MKKLVFLFVLVTVIIILGSCKGTNDPIVPPVDTSAKAEFKSLPQIIGLGNFIHKDEAVADPPGQVWHYLYYVAYYLKAGTTEVKVGYQPATVELEKGLGNILYCGYDRGKYCDIYLNTDKKTIYPVGKYRFGNVRINDQKVILELVDSIACSKKSNYNTEEYVAAAKAYGRYDVQTGVLIMDKE